MMTRVCFTSMPLVVAIATCRGDLYQGGWGEEKPNWDGVVDNLPTMGGYVGSSDWDLSGTGSLHSTRKLARSAGDMAKANGGVLWLSAVWYMPSQQFFAPVGLALASDESGFKDRAIALDGKNDAIGVGNGRNFRDGRKRLNPVIWIKGEEVAGTPGTDVDSKKDNIIIVKFEFGDTDKVSTWYFTEDQKMTEAAFDQHAARCSGSIDENTLDVLTIGTILKDNAIDEIRIGTSFESVITGNIPPRQEVRITKCQHDETSDSYEIVGFAWHQGTSDKSPPAVAEEYKYNLPDFIQAVRSEFGKPDLPFVIATTGMADVGPVKPYPYEGYHPVERAQIWVAGAEKPRNVLTDDTRGYWESVENSPVNQGFHWNQNARSYFRVGLGLGNDMVKLLEQ